MRLFAAIALAAALTASARAQVAAAADPAPRISQDEFKKLRAAGTVIVVDTRNAGTYEAGRIPGAVLLPVEGLATWPAEYEKVVERLKASKKPIVTYCA